MPTQAKKSRKANLKLDRSVVLVGLMGAGKTTIGRRLAGALDLPFIDADQEIVEAAGCSISDIFAVYGEQLFRDLEQRVMLRLLSGPPAVLATGGGAFVNPAIRRAVKEKALSVWLKAELEVLLERVSRRDTRPLLKTGNKRDIMNRLMETRYPVYAESDVTVDSNAGTHEAVVRRIVSALRDWQETHG